VFQLNETRPQDAVAILAIAAVALAVIVVRHAASWLETLRSAPRDLLDLALAHQLIAAAPIVTILSLALFRAVVTRLTLRSRVRLRVLPSETFDPSPEAAVRFATELSRLRPALAGFLDRRARALRVLLASDEQGQLRYALEVPRRKLGLLRTALGVYDQLELREEGALAADPPAADEPGGRLRSARAELVLARPSSEPLARLGPDPDPLQGFAAAFARLRPDLGDSALVAVSLLPCTPGDRGRVRRRLLERARRTAERPGLRAAVAGGERRQGRATPSELVARREEVRALDDKLGSSEPLLALQVLVRCQSRTRGRVVAQLESVLAGFDAFAGENHLRVRGLRVAGLRFLGSDMPLRRRRFDRRLESGLFRPARRGFVTPSEVAGLLKPPTVNCRAPNVERSGGAIGPPPPGLPTFAGQPELIPLGRVAGAEGEWLAGVRVAETFFSYMAGRSRYGKTETAIGQFVHLVRSGHGGLFLDPHSDALAEIKTYLTDPGVHERVVELNLADRGSGQRQPGWNPFAVSGLPRAEAANRVEAVVDALAAALGWQERNTRALNLATQAAEALVELAQALPPELAPTIFQVPTLLSDDEWRAAALPYLRPATRQFFEHRFPSLPGEAITAVTNVIDRLRAAQPVAALLGSPASSYDVRRAMDAGLIVLACPGSGSTRARLVANLLVYDVLHAAKARAALAPERRRPFWIFLDELQTYDGPNLPALLEQSAKYGGRAFLFNQNPERLSEATLNAVTTNRSHLLTTTLNARGAALVAREWGGEPSAQTVTALERYSYVAQVTLGQRPTRPFLVRGVLARELHAEHRHPDALGELEAAIDQAAARRPVAEVVAALDGHDERLRERLAARPPSDGEQAGDEGEGRGAQRLRTVAVPERRAEEGG
jgi:hypothetical protein